MKAVETPLPGVLVIEPNFHSDERGYFFESYNKRDLSNIGITADFVQDNQSRSQRYVLRGLHYQTVKPQCKLVRVLTGEIYDVAVDIRKSSPYFRKWFGIRLSADNRRMVWVPEGFAHGFLVLSEIAEVLYKITDYYAPELERAIAWNDPDLKIKWPLSGDPIISERDRAAKWLADAELFP